MQKTILKQQYENFVASRSEGLDLKDWIKPMIVWNNIALIMRNKSDLDTLSMDDLYNNLKVYEAKIKGQLSSSSNSQNVDLSSENTSSTNEAVNTDLGCLQLDNEDLEQIDTDDLEKMDLKWQVAMLTIRVKIFIKKTRREVTLPENAGHQGIRGIEMKIIQGPMDPSTTNALVVQDGIGGYDWSFQAEEGITNFALMAYTSQGSSSSSSSDSERVALNKSNLEIIGYQMGLESLEARIVVHEKNEAVYEEDIAFLKYDVQVKDISIKDFKNQFEEALKEKDDLKLKLEKFEESSKNLTKLINSQISANDKASLGYDSQINESEVVHSVFNSRKSDVDDSPVNDRFKTGEGFHAVPPPYTRNYMPSRAASSISTTRPVKLLDERGLTCLFAKATIDESNLWHMRLGHIIFKTMNKLVRGNLVRVAKRKNRTLIEAARTMLADSLLPTTFWAEAVSTACYVQNRVLVTKPHNKTPYELLHGRPPSISFMRHFGCPVTILNTLDPLGKFDGNADEGFFVGYSINSKVFRVFNTRTRKVEENMHITFLENKLNVAGSGLDWLFNIDLLTNSMNYEPVATGNQTNKNIGIKDNVDAVPTQQYILLPLLYDSPQSSKDAVTDDAGKKTNEEPTNEGERNGLEKDVREQEEALRKQFGQEIKRLPGQREATNTDSTNRVNTVSSSVNAVSSSFTIMDPGRERAQRNEFKSVFGQDKDTNGNSTYRMFTPVNATGYSYEDLGGSISVNAVTFLNDDFPTDPLMSDLEDIDDLLNTGIFSGAYDDEDVGVEADLNNLETTINVSHIPTTRIHKDHPKDQIIKDINSATQTRRMIKMSKEHAMVSYINKVIQALTNPSWIEAMQEELLQFKLQKVWTLVDLPKGDRDIGTKWVYRNKKDERGIVVRNN
ncbi:putative ribonuclease H-like domain-containing protein [Tanacetum coccineum]